MSKCEKLFKYVILVIFGIIIAALMLLSLFVTSYIEGGIEPHFYKTGIIWQLIIIAAVAAAGAVLSANRSRLKIFSFLYSKTFLIILTLVNVAVMAGWIMATRLEPDVDQNSVMTIAANMLEGDFSQFEKGKNIYMYIYPFQNGIVLFYYLISRLIGGNRYIALQLINIPFLVLGIFAVYRITMRLWRGNISKWIYILMPLWFPVTMYVTFIYGTIPGFALSMLAIMFAFDWFNARKPVYIILSAVFIALATVIKSNYYIFMIALLLLYMADLLHAKNMKSLAAAALTLILAVLFSKGTDAAMESITGIPVSDGIPKSAWVAMGLTSDENYGWWNGYNLYVYNKNNMDYDAANRESLDYISARIKIFAQRPRYAFNFFGKKIASMWCNPDFGSFEIQKNRESRYEMSGIAQSLIYGDLGRALTGVWDVVQTLIYFGAFMWILLDHKDINLYQLIFAVLFIGGFLFQIAWEGKCQYTIVYFYLLIPYAVKGWNTLFVRLTRRAGYIRQRYFHQAHNQEREIPGKGGTV